jgi:hypothetical protein
MSLMTWSKFFEHSCAMLINLIFWSVNGANFNISIEPMMPDSGVLKKDPDKSHCSR